VKNGVPVLVEKPLARNASRTQSLFSALEKTDAFVAVGYNFRFHPAIREMKRRLGDGLIGELQYVRAEVGQYLPTWRNTDYRGTVSARKDLGGGALLELSHDIDYVRWVAGDVRAVRAHTTRVSELDIDVEDTAEIILEMESGAVGSVHLDMVQRAPTRSCRLAGTEGTLAWTAGEAGVELRQPGSKPEQFALDQPVDRNKMYRRELEEFLRCVEEDGTPTVSATEGLRTLEIVEAARESARKGERVTI
jgi:predicted dehydrogenase